MRRPHAIPTVRSAATLLAALCGCSAPMPDSPPPGPDLEAVTPTSACRAPVADDSPVHIADDITYAVRGADALRLDMAWPQSPEPMPLVVLLHGGGWSGGSRQAMRAEMLAFARMGYPAAAVEYRLTTSPANVFPAAMADLRCAIRFLRRHARRYGIDGTRVVAAGYSAGAHLASLLGVTADVPELDGACDHRGTVAVQGVVAYAGPQDLRVRGPYTREQAEIVTNFLGVFPGAAPEVARLASPVAHVRRGAPPYLLIHGVEDDLVPVHHAHWMRDALHEAGSRATVIELRGQGHGFVGLATSSHPTVRCTVRSFLAAVRAKA